MLSPESQPDTDLLLKSEADHIVYEQALRQLDVHLIFNRHTNTSDAEDSFRYIEPGSIVFLEGFTNVVPHEESLRPMLRFLSHLRVANGIESEEYQHFKKLALDHLRSMSYHPATNYNDFNQHGDRLLILALEADCAVSYADYAPSSQNTPLATAHYDTVMKGFSFRKRDPLLTETVDPNVARTIRKMYEIDATKNDAHLVREAYAVASVKTYIAKHAIDLLHDTDMSRNSEGTLNVSIIYGSAHSHSLVDTFERGGVQTRQTVVNAAPEAFLVHQEKTYVDVARRRVAFTALSSLISQPVADSFGFGNDDEMDTIYKNLESITDDESAALALLIRSIQINKLLRINSIVGMHQLSELYTELLQRPSVAGEYVHPDAVITTK